MKRLNTENRSISKLGTSPSVDLCKAQFDFLNLNFDHRFRIQYFFKFTESQSLENEVEYDNTNPTVPLLCNITQVVITVGQRRMIKLHPIEID